MSKALVIVFAKNLRIGKVKTRLAKTIGEQGALEVYKELVTITENAVKRLSVDTRIYFSHAIDDASWQGHDKYIQQGKDLGARMKNAFSNGFNEGYDRIVLIGSDLPDITPDHLIAGLNAIKDSDMVFGPAIDGGYYLIGMSKMLDCVFEDKPWSQQSLLEVTLAKLKQNNISYTLLESLNDIDTFEDLESSSFYRSNESLRTRIKQLHG